MRVFELDSLALDRPDDDVLASPADTVEVPKADSLEVQKTWLPFYPYIPLHFKEISTDSLARWQLWTDPGERLARSEGVVSSRIGGQGRNDGFIINGYEPRSQRLFLNGIPINERIFGSANRNRLPHYSRMASVHYDSGGLFYRSEFTLNRYYVSKPLTFINYEQTSYEYRSTEGFLTQNISPRMNLSLAYWGKNEDEGYRNMSMGGRNIQASLYYFVNDLWLVETTADYSGLQLGEPGGFLITDMNNFTFDRFAVQPRNASARSSMRNTRFNVTAYRRPNPDASGNVRISAYYDRYRRLYYSNTDSTSVRTQTGGVSAMTTRHVGLMEVTGLLRSEWSAISQDRFHSMSETAWGYHEAEWISTFSIIQGMAWTIRGRGAYRTDSFTDYEAGAALDLYPVSGLHLNVKASLGTQMPLPGHLYWNSNLLSGDETLKNEWVQRLEASFVYASQGWEWGLNAFVSDRTDPILIGQDHTFFQHGDVRTMGASSWIRYNGNRMEGSLSGTFLQYESDYSAFPLQLLSRSGQRVWSRMSFYYKNYVFDQAAFIKAGFYVQVSPTAYRAMQYHASMDYWDPNSWHYSADRGEAQAIPDFARLDLDLTARVRSAIFLFRFENVLDDWLTPPGYFETPWYPMPSRRLRFGIRWVLRN